MEAQGLNLLARLTDIDNIWSTHEVSGEEENFFSLDLDFLSQEVAKIDIAERLFVDPKYIPLEERKKAEAMYKDSWAEIDDGNETFLSPASRTNSRIEVLAKGPASASPNEVNLLSSSSTTVHEEAGRRGVLDHRIFEGAETSFNVRENTFQSNSIEVTGKKLPESHKKIRTILKETQAELPKTTNDMFDAKSAEAELDAFLDMLDNKCVGESDESLLPIKSLGSVRSEGSASQGSYLDARQEDSPLDPSVDAFSGMQLNSNVGTSSDSRLHIKGSSEVAVKVGNAPSRAPAVGSVNSVAASTFLGTQLNSIVGTSSD
eukprot:c18841_g2_i1 orf=1-951(-)